jgi:type VI secretion system protein ImpH
MDTGGGPGPDDLTHFAQLARSPQTHHLFHALRILEARFADAPRLGESRRASQDRVRLEQVPELAFPPSTIASFQPPRQGRPARLVNRFFGLFGPHGPLPLHLTEYARDRQRNHRDNTFVAFANMLTHRMTGLFYRAWAQGQPAPSFDRGKDDMVEARVAALAGYAGQPMRGADAMPDLAKRHFAGLLASGSKHPDGLIAILSAFFDAPVRLQQFVGSWLTLEPSDRWRLGARTGLGAGTSLGSRVWSRGAKFRLVVGPLDLASYRRLLPGQGALERMEAVVRNYIGDRLDWDVNLVLKAAEVPRTALGAGAALGHTTWVGRRRDMRHDANDLYLTPPSQTRRARALAGH